MDFFHSVLGAEEATKYERLVSVLAVCCFRVEARTTTRKRRQLTDLGTKECWPCMLKRMGRAPRLSTACAILLIPIVLFRGGTRYDVEAGKACPLLIPVAVAYHSPLGREESLVQFATFFSPIETAKSRDPRR